jgi:pSer/pThr/pTyr-binding forkhead associated (FHA) protein
MPVRLTIRPPRTNEARVVEFDDACVTIGRSSRCDIRLPFRIVSGHHLTITQSPNSLKVRDERSTNGTFLDGERLEAGTERQISWGSILEIVDLSIEVELVPDLDAGRSLDQTGPLTRQMLGEALLGSATDEDVESAYFEVIEGEAPGQRFTIPDDLERGRISGDKNAGDKNAGDKNAGKKVAGHEDALISLTGLDTALEIYRDGDGFGLGLAHDAVAETPVRVGDTPLIESRRLTSGELIVAGSISLRFVDPLETYLDELDGVIPPTNSPASGVSKNAEQASEPKQVELDRAEPKDPGSETRSLSAIEVGVIAISVVVLSGVVFLLLSIFGVF